MSGSAGVSRQRSIPNKFRGTTVPSGTANVNPRVEDMPFEPCAATASLLLFSQGSTVVCLHHDTLAIERRFEKHSKDIQLIAADSVSETGTGRLVVSYDVGRTAIVWDLLTGEQLSRFVSYESLRVAHWMRNGNIVFGNAKGEVILFEPPTSDHISARTIFDPITAIAPSSDCKTYAIGYNNGSILLAALQPSFTILHTLTTSRAPSPIASLTWHASSSKQKSDMLATQTADGDLRVWSVSKPPTAEAPRVIRALKGSDAFVAGRNWITWSKNGRIVQFSDGKTWAWDVRTKHVTSESIPTVDGVRALAAYGPTGTLFTLGPDYTVQQYDVERAVMVANVRHMPITIPPTPPEDGRGLMWTTSGSEDEPASPAQGRREHRSNDIARHERKNTHIPSPQSTAGSHRAGIKQGGNDMTSPAGRTEYTTTTLDSGMQSQSMLNQAAQLASLGHQQQSPVTAKSIRKGSRLRQEVVITPQEQPVQDLFPYTRARLHDVPYRQPRPIDEALLTPHDLRRQMLHVVFGWEEDIQDLVRDELSRHPAESQNAIFLAKWLDEDPDYLAEILGSTNMTSNLDWMLLALGTISNQVGAKKITQVFIEKLLSKGDVHAAATLLLALGDRSDAIEVYVTRNQYMEAVLLTCLVTPADWQRQSYLVRRWGEHVVENSQQSLAIRCFSCTGVEPSDPWTSPQAQLATQTMPQQVSSPTMPQIETLEPMQYPAIFHKTLERRRTLDAPTPVAMPAPPTPYRTAAAQGTRITPQTSALKLVTSFESQAKNTFKFPGLKPEDRTPTVGVAVTPIAESAIDRSALSPGGLGSYRLNNIRSINSALSGKTATPGGFQPSRLASIGETPVDVEAPEYPSAIPPRSASVPTELTGTKGGDKQGITSPVQHAAQGKQGLALLTSARYEPLTTPIRETPQTALGPHAAVRFPESNSHVTAYDEGQNDASRARTGSKNRKPNGLSIQTTVREANSGQEYLPPSSYAESLGRPTTTGSYTNTQMDTSIDLSSAPTTGQSQRRVKSPLTTARSMDPFISSLEQAQYFGKLPRARGYSSTSKNSREDHSERKKNRATNADDGSGRDTRRGIPSAKRSPSSPIPMSPEDIRMYSTSVESFDTMYSSNLSGMDRTSTPGSGPKLSRRGSQTTTKNPKHRHRSRSRHTGPRSKTGSRGTSRQPSPDVTLISPRGRSSSRRDKLGNRSPSSPRPMIPSEEDRRSRFDQGSSMRLVSLDRHRMQRSTSRQPERDTSARRDRSPDRRRSPPRSRSRQAEETSLHRRTSRSEGKKRRRRPSDMVDDRHARIDHPEANVLADSISQEDVSSGQPQLSTDRGRKEVAAEKLEARRQSLTRRPSAPNVLLPSQLNMHTKSASTGNVPPLTRAYTEDGSMMGSSSYAHQDGPDMSGVVLTKDWAGAPGTMHETAQVPKGAASASAGQAELLTSDVYRPPTREGPSRPGSARAPVSLEFLSQIPKHPAYDSRIGNSRSSSKGTDGRGSSRSRGASRDRTRTSPREAPPMSVGPAPGTSYTSSPPQQNPPILPELQHLAAPPPPPPPPKMSMSHSNLSLSNLHALDAEAAEVPLPMSAGPGNLTDAPYSGRSFSATSTTPGHRRGRSANDSNGGSGGGSNPLIGKIRNFAGRVRSPSRGRRGDDNQAMSPRSNTEQVAPYESIQATTT